MRRNRRNAAAFRIEREQLAGSARTSHDRLRRGGSARDPLRHLHRARHSLQRAVAPDWSPSEGARLWRPARLLSVRRARAQHRAGLACRPTAAARSTTGTSLRRSSASRRRSRGWRFATSCFRARRTAGPGSSSRLELTQREACKTMVGLLELAAHRRRRGRAGRAARGVAGCRRAARSRRRCGGVRAASGRSAQIVDVEMPPAAVYDDAARQGGGGMNAPAYDAGRLALMLNELRLPTIARLWPEFARALRQGRLARRRGCLARCSNTNWPSARNGASSGIAPNRIWTRPRRSRPSTSHGADGVEGTCHGAGQRRFVA